MNLSSELDRWLLCQAGVLLWRVGECAGDLGYRAFLVGGPVRDLLLGRPSLDLDVVVQGDAVAVALSAAMQDAPPPVVHPSFGTATLSVGDCRVDLASARAESYERPGALPVVRPGTIEQDLWRRDFTVNAMALALDGRDRGQLLDPYGGWVDLQHGLLRVLHEDSFVDDATRMLRGVRYEQRFGFSFEERTMGLLRRDVRRLLDISADRVRHELERTFAEAEPELSLLRLDSLELLSAIHPALRFGEGGAWAFAGARREDLSRAQLQSVYWCVLSWGMSADDIRLLDARLSLTRRTREAMNDAVVLSTLEAQLADAALDAAGVYDLLHGYDRAALVSARLLFRHALARERVALYLDRLCHVRPLLCGRDLQSLGVADGPEMGRILCALRAARLNGEVTSREQESALTCRLLQGAG